MNTYDPNHIFWIILNFEINDDLNKISTYSFDLLRYREIYVTNESVWQSSVQPQETDVLENLDHHQPWP